MNVKPKGYLLMFIVVVLHSIPPVAIKFAYQSTNAFTTQLIWFISASIWATIILFPLKKKTTVINDIKKNYKPLLKFLTFNTIGIITFFYALNELGPSMASFIDRSGTIFVIIFGIFILKEQFNKIELFGLMLSILGVFILSFTNDKVILITLLVQFIGLIIYSYSLIIVKKYSKKIDSFTFMFTRVWFNVILLGLMTLTTNSYITPAKNTYWIFIVLPLLTAVIGQIIQFYAYSLIDVGKASLFTNLIPFFVLIFSYIIFGDLLSIRQFIGGSIVVFGLCIIVLYKTKKANVETVEEEI
jgi:drug/metabolite transporter (DMT)-like permease